jgi:peroxiredoxin
MFLNIYIFQANDSRMSTEAHNIAFGDIRTNANNNLYELSQKQPVLLVFLRQLGCMFCKEAMTRLGNSRAYITATGVKIVLVHMAKTNAQAEKILKKYNLDGLEVISDPSCAYYVRFGLAKSTVSQLFGFTAWARTVEYAYIKADHGIQVPIGDGFQMAGMFVLQNGEIINRQQQQEVYDIPDDFEGFISCCAI